MDSLSRPKELKISIHHFPYHGRGSQRGQVTGPVSHLVQFLARTVCCVSPRAMHGSHRVHTLPTCHFSAQGLNFQMPAPAPLGKKAFYVHKRAQQHRSVGNSRPPVSWSSPHPVTNGRGCVNSPAPIALT